MLKKTPVNSNAVSAILQINAKEHLVSGVMAYL